MQSIDENGIYDEGLRCPVCNGTGYTEFVDSDGIECTNCNTVGYRNNTEDFKTLWDSINKKRGYGWDFNPYCFVYEYKYLEV